MICWYRRESSLLRIEDNPVKTQTRFRWLAVLAILLIVAGLSLEAFSNSKPPKKRQHVRGPTVLWHDPGNIRKRDLFYGPGSKALTPVPPFRFLKEIKEGTQPKFDAEDARGVKWRVKLGPEAQSETVATRLVWAADITRKRLTTLTASTSIICRDCRVGRSMSMAGDSCAARNSSLIPKTS